MRSQDHDLFEAWRQGEALGQATVHRVSARCATADQYDRVAMQWLAVLRIDPAQAVALDPRARVSTWAGSSAWEALERGFSHGALGGTLAHLGAARFPWTGARSERAGRGEGYRSALTMGWPLGSAVAFVASSSLELLLARTVSLDPRRLHSAPVAAGERDAFLTGAAEGLSAACLARARFRRVHLRSIPRRTVNT